MSTSISELLNSDGSTLTKMIESYSEYIQTYYNHQVNIRPLDSIIPLNKNATSSEHHMFSCIPYYFYNKKTSYSFPDVSADIAYNIF